jgi:hypothetical protein
VLSAALRCRITYSVFGEIICIIMFDIALEASILSLEELYSPAIFIVLHMSGHLVPCT